MEHETRFELAFPSRSATSHTRCSLIALSSPFRWHALKRKGPAGTESKPQYEKIPPCSAGRDSFVYGARDRIRTGDPHVGNVLQVPEYTQESLLEAAHSGTARKFTCLEGKPGASRKLGRPPPPRTPPRIKLGPIWGSGSLSSRIHPPRPTTHKKNQNGFNVPSLRGACLPVSSKRHLGGPNCGGQAKCSVLCTAA